MLNNIKKIATPQFFVVSLATMAVIAAFGFFNIQSAYAAPGDVRVTVTRQGDDAALVSALVEIKCAGGVYTPFDGTPLTDVSGQVQGAPPLAANCDSDEETINARVTLENYVTKNNEGGPLQGWYSNVDPNEISLTGVEFGFSVYVADQFGTAIDTVDNIQFNGNAPTLQDPTDTNRFYWEDTGSSNRELLIEKDGFVTFSTTNTGGTDISTSQTEQVLITLGDSPVCSNPIVGPNNCKGLEYAYIYPRIQNELGANLSSVTLTAGQANVSCIEGVSGWYCPITIADGVYDRYVATKDGYVERANAGGLFGGARSVNADPQVDLGTISNVQFSHKFITKDELGNNLTLTSATAGASNVACTISSNNVYCPITLGDDNTLANGLVGVKDGYVTTTAANVPLGSNRALHSVAQALTTMTAGNGLDFSHKVAIKDELNVALTGATATGGANDTACTISTSFAYCPIPLADDNVLDATTAYAITKDGYVTAVPFLAGSRAAGTDAQVLLTMDATNGLDFSHRFIIKDELGVALTVTSATAGSASVACTISTSTAYCPVLLAQDNTLSNGLVAAKDGYVTTTAVDVPLASNRTANTDAQGVTTLTTTNGLDFAAKATVVLINTANVLTGATVTAGNSGLVSCAESGTTGTYYCAVPLADTDTTIRSVLSGYTSAINNFADRTAATDAQQAITIQMNTTGGSSGGGGSSNNNTTPPVLTPPSTTPENPAPLNIVDRINAEKDMVFAQTNPESYFINTGTDSTLGLGSGERAAAVSSFKEAYGRAPVTAADWVDVLNIANGRWPITVNKTVEARAYTNFKLVYGRNADMTNSTDVNALKMMGYGVRGSSPRDLNAERAAISRFRTVFGFNPTTARHWNIMRAIAYSGVIK